MRAPKTPTTPASIWRAALVGVEEWLAEAEGDPEADVPLVPLAGAVGVAAPLENETGLGVTDAVLVAVSSGQKQSEESR